MLPLPFSNRWLTRRSPALPVVTQFVAMSRFSAVRYSTSLSCAIVFYETLDLDEEHRIVPENAHLFVATGAALAGESDKIVTFASVIEALENLGDTQGSEVERLQPLFEDAEAYDEFKERHNAQVVPRGDLAGYKGRVFIGIDAGSTTMKAAMVGEDGQLLHTWYGSNNGDILGTARVIMDDFYVHIPEGCTIWPCNNNWLR